ncbi:hypothetical protein D9757_010692 [Collybiopsis confluens]|uniref:Uncharacterized protein n=1 Tax=Collybiopsis confluens TaxID=2823264 RepID=A0A8H5H9L4_9AGAR|nr:hypothetical protein D9757_010692 [Collybiopsis confluens]
MPVSQPQRQSIRPPTINECPKISGVKFAMNAPTWSRLQTRILDGSSSSFPIKFLSTEITEGQVCSVNLRKSGLPDGSLVCVRSDRKKKLTDALDIDSTGLRLHLPLLDRPDDISNRLSKWWGDRDSSVRAFEKANPSLNSLLELRTAAP